MSKKLFKVFENQAGKLWVEACTMYKRWLKSSVNIDGSSNQLLFTFLRRVRFDSERNPSLSFNLITSC